MSQISLKSISGITSITTPAGVDNQFTIHTNNTTEAFKLDHAGNLHFHNHLSITGVSTASNFKTGTSNLHNTGLNIQDLDVDGHTNLDNVSVAGVSTFTGNVIVDNGTVRCNDGFSSDVDLILNADANNNGTGSIIFKESGSEKFRVGYSGQLGIGGPNYGTSGQVLTSGGSGSAVTWSTISGTTINNNSDDRLITGTGTANTINAEADLTFDGTSLKLTDHKNMYFGTGNDLRIWHDANNSYSQIAGGQKNLYIDGLTTYMRSGDGGGSGVENAIVMNNNASVDLYYSGTKKFATDSTGFYSTNYGDYIAVSSNGSTGSGRFGYESNYKMYLQNTRGTGTKVIFDNDGKIRSQISDGSSIVDRFEVNVNGATVTGDLTASGFVDSSSDIKLKVTGFMSLNLSKTFSFQSTIFSFKLSSESAP